MFTKASLRTKWEPDESFYTALRDMGARCWDNWVISGPRVLLIRNDADNVDNADVVGFEFMSREYLKRLVVCDYKMLVIWIVPDDMPEHIMERLLGELPPEVLGGLMSDKSVDIIKVPRKAFAEFGAKVVHFYRCGFDNSNLAAWNRPFYVEPEEW